MATKKKTAAAAEPVVVEQRPVPVDVVEAAAPAAVVVTVDTAPVVEDVPDAPAPVTPYPEPDPIKTVGTQFMETISRAADGTKIEALQIGQRGVIVVIGFAAVFVPGADIVDRGAGKQIV